MEKLNKYTGDSINVTYTELELADLAGYTANAAIKANPADVTPVLEKAGQINGLVASWAITKTENNLPPGRYFIFLLLESATEQHTVGKIELNITQGT